MSVAFIETGVTDVQTLTNDAPQSVPEGLGITRLDRPHRRCHRVSNCAVHRYPPNFACLADLLQILVSQKVLAIFSVRLLQMTKLAFSRKAGSPKFPRFMFGGQALSVKRNG
jgi:hypothetical protein